MNVKELWAATDTERSNPPAFEWAEKFAALVEAAADGKWKRAVIDELMTCHIYTAAHENDPRKALQDLISWNVQVALDPLVSSDARALIGYVTALEREECAKLAAWILKMPENDVSSGIRARG